MENAALNLLDQPTHPSDKTTPSTDDKGLPGSDPLTTSSQTCLVPPQLDGTYNKTFGTALLSPKTCLELFSTLTEEQLKHESAYHSTFCGFPDLSTGDGMQTRKKKAHVYEHLKQHLNDHLTSNIDDISKKLRQFTSVTSHFSEKLQEAENHNVWIIGQLTESTVAAKECITDMLDASAANSRETLRPTPPPTQPNTVTLPTIIPGAVEPCDINFEQLDLKTVCQGVKFTKIGHRQTAFFGKTEYRYGKTVHKPLDIPTYHPLLEIIDSIAHHTQDASFNTDNITCLLTRYENGKSSIPMHSDNEACIVESSNIITVSLGATRTIHFRSKAGPLTTQSIHLKHGQTYIMSRFSQDFWEHGIQADPTADGERLSLTFRRLSAPITPQRIPPIRQSSLPETDPTPLPTERVLLLTDSIHSSTPVSLFPAHLPCTKETMYQITELHKFEHLFPHMSYVVISSGINDLSRYNHRSYSLFDVVSEDLRTYCERYPNTTFIFNSISLTTYHWLNPEIRKFNESLLILSTKVVNLWMFDSHQICQELSRKRCIILDPAGNGIHLTLAAKRVIVRRLLDCIVELAGRRPTVEGMWPLRDEFRSLLPRQ